MKKIVQDKNNKVSYRIRSSKRAKRLRIAVYYNGDVLVTKPRRVSYGFTENVVNNNVRSVVFSFQHIAGEHAIYASAADAEIQHFTFWNEDF